MIYNDFPAGISLWKDELETVIGKIVKILQAKKIVIIGLAMMGSINGLY